MFATHSEKHRIEGTWKSLFESGKQPFERLQIEAVGRSDLHLCWIDWYSNYLHSHADLQFIFLIYI